MQRAGHSFGNFLFKNLGKQTARFSTMEAAEQVKSFDISKEKKLGRAIYFDMQATTPMDFRVLDAMMPYSTNMYGNPHSKNHEYGWETETAVKTAREQVAKIINADAKEIVFTSGATESNNLALKGLAGFYKTKKHVITTVTVRTSLISHKINNFQCFRNINVFWTLVDISRTKDTRSTIFLSSQMDWSI